MPRVKNLAIVLDSEGPIQTYADRQKDETSIGLCGNVGSGRAVYYGRDFNILGVGKTTLCKSSVPSHSTGNLELVGAMRRVIVSHWINCFTQRAPTHPALFALTQTTNVKWNSHPIPLSLLVRVDGGSLDRPSHVEQSPDISVDFKTTITEYAKLDAEYFAYRIMLGAWSTSNYSLGGHVIDLESASFVPRRGPYATSSLKYPETRFGYEGIGFLKILHRLARLKNIQDRRVASRFWKKRRAHLGYCFLLLLGLDTDVAPALFSKYRNRVMPLADEFERLSKKITSADTDLKLYHRIADDEDPSLLDMSKLFRNLARLYRSPHRDRIAFECLVGKPVASPDPHGGGNTKNKAESFLRNHAVVPPHELGIFFDETKNFIHDLFAFLDTLHAKNYLSGRAPWHDRLQFMNQDLPPMFELNTVLIRLAESYRRGDINPKILGIRIRDLCELPNK